MVTARYTVIERSSSLGSSETHQLFLRFQHRETFPSFNADSFMFLYFPNLPLDSPEIRFTLASNLNLVFFRRRRRRRRPRGPVDSEYATSSV